MFSFDQVDFSKVEAEQGFSKIPDGEYDAIIEASELKPTKDGQGQYINFTYVIFGGEFNGRKVFDICNVVNKSDVAVRIGLARIKNMLEIQGMTSIKDSAELHGKPFKLTLINEDKDGRNNIRVKSIAASEVKIGKPSPANSAKAPAKSSSQPPWMK